MTNTSGTVVWKTDYKPFGEEQSKKERAGKSEKERGQACKHANKTANGFGGSVTSVNYNTAGLPTSFSYSNGIANSITYNSRNFTTRIQAGTALDVGYGYDSRGNTSSMTNYLDTTKNQSFGYDSLSRLTSFNGAWSTGAYSYDSKRERAGSGMQICK